MRRKLPRIVIAGERSGTGKSTIAVGILMALKARGIDVQPFKVGPDFLDPMHHSIVTGKTSRNLDTWMFADYVPKAFANGMQGSEMAVIEGVMGFYDGFDGVSEEGSTAHLSKVIKAPVVLVLNASASARSLGAVAKGFMCYDKDVNIAAVIFNNVAGKRHLEMLVASLRGEVPCLGGIPRRTEMNLESRHLGLVPAKENFDQDRYEIIRRTMEENLDLDMLIDIARTAPSIDLPRPERIDTAVKVRLGVAMDEAFNFYYQDNLDMLRARGAEIIPFSPLHGEMPDVDGIYFGGGYPEMFAEGLSRNADLREAVRKAAEEGMPMYAECGGLMYMCRSMRDLDGKEFPMTGVFDATVEMTSKLEALGYVEARMVRDNVMGDVGDISRGHVFHYSKVVRTSETDYAYDLNKVKGIEGSKDGFVRNNVLASYTHLHFGSNPRLIENFLRSCLRYRDGG